MTATNHAVTGALVALAIDKPLIAIPLAFGVHFLMDMIPHFGLGHTDAMVRNKDKRFRYILLADCTMALILLIALPILSNSLVAAWIIFACMFACMSPDLVWGWHFYHEIVHKTLKDKTWFSNSHKKIQWSETPFGAVTEIAWFISILALIAVKK